MPGRMGHDRVTVLNLEVVRVGRGAQPHPRQGSRARSQRRSRRRPLGRQEAVVNVTVADIRAASAPARSTSTTRSSPRRSTSALMHQVVVAQLAAARAGTHSTKTRGEVRGGGAKPWRQKGTGRARHGRSGSRSGRAAAWRSARKPRDHSVGVPKKMKAAALRSALSARAGEEQGLRRRRVRASRSRRRRRPSRP